MRGAPLDQSQRQLPKRACPYYRAATQRILFVGSALISNGTSGSPLRGKRKGGRGNVRFIYDLKNADMRYGHRAPPPSSSPLRLPLAYRLSHFSFAAGLPLGIVPSSFICLKDPFVHSSSSCFTCKILYAFPTPFDLVRPAFPGLANDDASRFVDETTITRYTISTILRK